MGIKLVLAPLLFTAIAFATPAEAEAPSYAYVGLRCARNLDGSVDGAILLTARVAKFQDGDTNEYTSAPAFPDLPVGVDHGLSMGILTIPGAKNDQATCGGSPSMIVVRHGASPVESDDDQEWISVWVGNRKILSRFPIAYEKDSVAPQPSDDAILIMGSKVSVCRHATKSIADCKSLGDVTTMGVEQDPFLRGGIAPGRIAATFAQDPKLCSSLIKSGAIPGDANLSYLSKPDNHDESYYLAPQDQDSIGFGDVQTIKGEKYDFRNEADQNPFVETAVYDLANSGQPQLVLSVESENHFMSGNYLVGVPLAKLSPDIVKSAVALMDTLDDKKTPDVIFKKGWRLFSAKDTQYTAARYSALTPGRVNGVTYILVTSQATSWKAKGDDSVALLMKPAPDGSMTKICEYHRGAPIF